ncbi:nitronate monooxygenase [Spongiibacter taiwanensis]|uniref:NAD(P)H-dependent flavin oxidoreductase n=1 Tax=Spongiibacter taiwanensis TaxID=1748242 RepID=UPI0020364213|nr:nitronate monooxygenase [Spongiibacter taiwanensis]USA41949.1 nitronate monooxygenase [Spongiibacter taiwanensis]
MNLSALLGTDYPILQAPMAGVQDSALAIAVSNAGGLGALPCGMLSKAQIGKEVGNIRSQTQRPFNLNFFAHRMPHCNEEKILRWQHQFSAYFEEYGIDTDAPLTGPLRRPFDEEMADLVSECQPRVVSFHFGLPPPELIEPVRRAGAKIIATATTVHEAIWLESRGVDAIIAQGLEAGGHRGMFLTDDLREQKTLADLLPQVASAVSLPVIAAGGIMSSKDVKAAFHLGAAGVQVGTAYLLCPEANTSGVHRKAIKDTKRDTAITNVFSGRAARGIANRLMMDIGPLNPDAPPFPLASAATSELRKKAEAIGIDHFTPLWAGSHFKDCKEISAATLTEQLASEI